MIALLRICFLGVLLHDDTTMKYRAASVTQHALVGFTADAIGAVVRDMRVVSVCLKSFSLSPGNPTIKSEDRLRSGLAR